VKGFTKRLKACVVAKGGHFFNALNTDKIAICTGSQKSKHYQESSLNRIKHRQ